MKKNVYEILIDNLIKINYISYYYSSNQNKLKAIIYCISED